MSTLEPSENTLPYPTIRALQGISNSQHLEPAAFLRLQEQKAKKSSGKNHLTKHFGALSTSCGRALVEGVGGNGGVANKMQFKYLIVAFKLKIHVANKDKKWPDND